MFAPLERYSPTLKDWLPNISVWSRALLFCAFFGLVPGLPAQFSERALEAGLHAESQSARAQNTGGVWVVDINADGWPDIYTTRLSGGSQLFINQQDGTFSEAAESYGLLGTENAHAALFGDIDNDGDPDLFLGLLDGERHYLYENDGAGHFEEVAESRGVDLPTNDPAHRAYGPTWGDFDADGYLDLHVPEWFNTGISAHPNLNSSLLRNRGSESPGHFENVTAAAGVTIVNESDRQHAFASAFADIDQDGWPDLLVTGDFGTSRFFKNRGDGTFEDATASYQTNQAQNAMGIAVGDFDGDLHLDYYETSIYDNPGQPQPRGYTGNRLYQYRPELNRFSEVSSSKNVRNGGFGWGTTFFDFDNDGDLDLLATNAVFTLDGSLPDLTRLWVNDGVGNFTEAGEALGITDDGNGYGVATLDYDRDGDLDLLIGQKEGELLLYRNDASPANAWLRLSLKGTLSNRDGIGAKILVTQAGGSPSQYFEYNPTNLFMAQSEAIQHIGLGPGTDLIAELTINWPSGVSQRLSNIVPNQLIEITEPSSDELTPPSVVTSPTGLSLTKGSPLELTVVATGTPPPSVQWYHNETPIAGATSSILHIDKTSPHQAGNYRARLSSPQGAVSSEVALVVVELGDAPYSIARWWNELLLDAIRKDFPAPTVHARNLYHTSAAMWDAFWAFEVEGWNRAVPTFHQEQPSDLSSWSELQRKEAQREAISHAAYGILVERYKASDGAYRSLYDFRWLMEQLGYDPENNSAAGDSPAAIGNRIAARILSETINDGSNEKNGYIDPNGYTALNQPLAFTEPGTTMQDPNRWQPLAFDKQVTQNGIELAASIQEFVGSHWGHVTPFSLDNPKFSANAFDPGPPPLLGVNDDQFISNTVEVILYSSFLDPDDNTRIDISPKARFRNSLGSNDGDGYSINPSTGEAYAENKVKLADYGRVLAEFWADGPSSETPPGHWNALFNQVSDHPDFVPYLMGKGAPISRLKWDVISYLTVNGAMHDAAILAWGAKRDYDYSRPISMIRYLGGLGQSSDPDGPAYHPQGLPLIDNLIAVVTAESSATDREHQHLAASIGEVAIRAWLGQPEDYHTQSGGVGWILAKQWIPYQRSTFVTPAFAAYVSGHSCFSRAGAEALTLLTGSPYFPGGLGEYTFSAHDYLEFESGPSETLTLQWATYYDAADQAGLSRLYGGIHVSPDDLQGRELGAKVGLAAFLKTQTLLNAGARPETLTPLKIRSTSLQNRAPLIVALAEDTASTEPIQTEFEFNGTDVTLSVSSEHEVSAVTALATSDGLELTFEISNKSPQTFLIRTLENSELWPSKTGEINKSSLSLHSINENNSRHLIASNANWQTNDLASLITTSATLFDTPHSEPAINDAALFVQLEAGRHVLVVESLDKPAIHFIELKQISLH